MSAKGRPVTGAESGGGPRRATGELRNHAEFIWQVLDLLRGDYKRSGYGSMILPITVLRRLDGVLAPTKDKVLKKSAELHRQAGLRNSLARGNSKLSASEPHLCSPA